MVASCGSQRNRAPESPLEGNTHQSACLVPTQPREPILSVAQWRWGYTFLFPAEKEFIVVSQVLMNLGFRSHHHQGA